VAGTVRYQVVGRLEGCLPGGSGSAKLTTAQEATAGASRPWGTWCRSLLITLAYVSAQPTGANL
jgi:hypothetical protein